MDLKYVLAHRISKVKKHNKKPLETPVVKPWFALQFVNRVFYPVDTPLTTIDDWFLAPWRKYP
jgi:hypothetical protein